MPEINPKPDTLKAAHIMIIRKYGEHSLLENEFKDRNMARDSTVVLDQKLTLDQMISIFLAYNWAIQSVPDVILQGCDIRMFELWFMLHKLISQYYPMSAVIPEKGGQTHGEEKEGQEKAPRNQRTVN